MQKAWQCGYTALEANFFGDKMTHSEVQTAILRFRDLATAAGETIAAHRGLISARGEVWWGWWSKGGERVPAEVFQRLNNFASNGLRLYLFDSGSGGFYSAACREIAWSNRGEEIPSPEPEKTPDYYRDTMHLAWFRLERIDDVDLNPLEWTYVRVDEFFTSGKSLYEPFYGKRVHSVEELRQQDRSIWFVRAADNTDPLHEVSLLDPRRFRAEHFQQHFNEVPSSTLLWLSDLHFSDGDHHGFPLTDQQAQKSLATAILRDLRELGEADVAGVLISGDLTWRASVSEFAMVRNFLDSLSSGLRLRPYDIILCPGNHDIAFSQDPAEKGAPVERAHPEARVSFAEFFRGIFYIEPNEFGSSGRRLLVGGSVPMELVSLNSSLLDQTPGRFQGHGFVGDEQLSHAASEYGWQDASRDRPFRVVILHHHVLPVTERELPVQDYVPSTTLDAGALLSWARRCGVDAILHGHMHQPFAARIALPDTSTHDENWRTTTVVAMGSSGVSVAHLGEVGRNLIGLVRARRDELGIEMWPVSPLTTVDRDGGPLHSVTIPHGLARTGGQ